MQQPNDQQQTQLQRFYRKELDELAQTRDALRAKHRPHGNGSDSDYDKSSDDQDDDDDLAGFGNRYGSEIEAANMDTHIPESNIGYRLLLKMGWKAGTGLGQNATGRTAPIPIENKQDVLGLGKQQVDTWYNETSTAKRKTTEVERQAEETEEARVKREHHVEQQKAIKAELDMVKSAFYCALCDKQYERISDYEVHLSSYDHNHKKRFKEMKDTSRAGAAGITNKIKEKERKREERELAKLQEAAMKKAGGMIPTATSSTQSQQSTTPSGTTGSQPVKLGGFQPIVVSDSSTGSHNAPVTDATQGVGSTTAGTSGFQPVKMGGFQPVKLGGFQPVKVSGFQPVEDEDDQAPQTTTSAQSDSSQTAPKPSGFQPVKIGGFKPMKIGGFQVKKPGAK
ncbi:G patch domain-containing protein 8 [Mortierella sp. NVP85]|nr:G patch domain-containing protein 8 [Mortierella sp. NVP85]